MQFNLALRTRRGVCFRFFKLKPTGNEGEGEEPLSIAPHRTLFGVGPPVGGAPSADALRLQRTPHSASFACVCVCACVETGPGVFSDLDHDLVRQLGLTPVAPPPSHSPHRAVAVGQTTFFWNIGRGALKVHLHMPPPPPRTRLRLIWQIKVSFSCCQ